jgi:hypothetical protein
VPAKANSTIDFDDRHTRVEAFPQAVVGVDINDLWHKAMLREHSVGLVAKVTPFARVKDNMLLLIHHRSWSIFEATIEAV